jgi:hypothetical protein
VWADRLQAGAAPRTEAEARLDLGMALRTPGSARLAQDEIEDDSQSIGDKDCNERPQQTAHPAPPSVPVYVADQHNIAAAQRSRDDSQQPPNRNRRCIVIPAGDDHNQHNHPQEGHDRKKEGPRRNDSDLVLEARGSLISDCHHKSPNSVLSARFHKKTGSRFDHRSLNQPS